MLKHRGKVKDQALANEWGPYSEWGAGRRQDISRTMRWALLSVDHSMTRVMQWWTEQRKLWISVGSISKGNYSACLTEHATIHRHQVVKTRLPLSPVSVNGRTPICMDLREQVGWKLQKWGTYRYRYGESIKTQKIVEVSTFTAGALWYTNLCRRRIGFNKLYEMAVAPQLMRISQMAETTDNF